MSEILPAWMNDRSIKRRQNARSLTQEKVRAIEIGGKVQPGSGSSRRQPQDVKTETHLEQVKFTDRDRYPLDARELRKLINDANIHGRADSFLIEFTRYGLRVRVTIEEG